MTATTYNDSNLEKNQMVEGGVEGIADLQMLYLEPTILEAFTEKELGSDKFDWKASQQYSDWYTNYLTNYGDGEVKRRLILSDYCKDLVTLMISFPRFKPASNSLIYSLLLKSQTFSATEFEVEERGRLVDVSKPNKTAITPGQFGRLGTLIGTQVFEFEEWDNYKLSPPKISFLIYKLIELKHRALELQSISDLDAVELLSPFLNVLRTGEAPTPVAVLTLTIVENILLEVNPNAPNLLVALDEVCDVLIQCKFESNETASDEVVVLKIIQIMTLLLTKPLVYCLTISKVTAVLQTALSKSCQLKLSPTLRYQAESHIRTCVVALFDDFLSMHSKLTYFILDLMISLLAPHNQLHSNYMRLLGLGVITAVVEKFGADLFFDGKLNDLISDRLCMYLWMLQDGDHLGIISKSLHLSFTLILVAKRKLKQQHLLWIQQTISRLNTLASNTISNYRASKDEEIGFLFTSFLLNILQFTPTLLAELFVNYDCQLNHPNIGADLVNFLVESNVRASTESNRSRLGNFWMDQIIIQLSNLVSRAQCSLNNQVLNKLTALEIPQQPAETVPSPTQIYCTTDPEVLLENQRQKIIFKEAVELFNQKAWTGIDHLITNNLLPNKEDPEFNKKLAHFLLTTVGLDKRVLGDFISKRDNGKILDAFIKEFDFENTRIDQAIRVFLESFRLPGESKLIERIFEKFSDHYFSYKPEFIADENAVFLLSYSILMLNTDQYNPQVKPESRMKFINYFNNIKGGNNGQNFDEGFAREIYDAIKKDEIIMPSEREGKHNLEYIWKFYTKSPAFSGEYMLCAASQYDREVFWNVANLLADLFIQTYSNSTSDAAIQTCLQGLYMVVMLSHHYSLPNITDYVVRRMTMLTGPILSKDDSSQFKPEAKDEDNSAQPRSSAPNKTQQVDGSVLSDLSLTMGQSYKSQLITLFLLNVVGDVPNSLSNAWWDVLDILKLFVDSFLLPNELMQIPCLDLQPGTTWETKVPIPFRPKVLNASRSTTNRRVPPSRPNSKEFKPTNKSVTLAEPEYTLEISTTDSNAGLFSTLSSYLGYSNQYPELIWDLSPQLLFAYLQSVRKLVPACNFAQVVHCAPKLDLDAYTAVLKRIMVVVNLQHSIVDPINPASDYPPPNDVESELVYPTGGTVTSYAYSNSRPDTPSSLTGSTQAPVNSVRKATDRYFPSTAFFFHWVVTSNLQRTDAYVNWPLVVNFLGDVFYHAEFYHPFLVQNAVNQLMTILFKVQPEEVVGTVAVQVLDTLHSLSPSVIEGSCHCLLAGFTLLHSTNPTILSHEPYWSTLIHILQVCVHLDDTLAVDSIFPLVQRLSETIHFIPIAHPDYLCLVDLLVAFSNPDKFIYSSSDAIADKVRRGSVAVQHLAALLPKVPLLANRPDPNLPSPDGLRTSAAIHFSNRSAPNAPLRSAFFLPPLIGLSSLATHRRKEIRNEAFSQLRKSLVAPTLLPTHSSTAKDWEVVFVRVLFPLVEQTLDLKAYADPTNPILEARGRMVALLGNVFLHFVSTGLVRSDLLESEASLQLRANYPTFNSLWLEVLDLTLRLVPHPDSNSQPLDSVVEVLKNMVLVLVATHLLYPPNPKEVGGIGLDPEVCRTSTHTWNLIWEVLPNILPQLFPNSNFPEDSCGVDEAKDLNLLRPDAMGVEGTKSSEGAREGSNLPLDPTQIPLPATPQNLPPLTSPVVSPPSSSQIKASPTSLARRISLVPEDTTTEQVQATSSTALAYGFL